MRTQLIALAVGAALIAGCQPTDTKSTAKPKSTSPTGAFQHASDVTILSCGRDKITGFAYPKIRITNRSSKTSTYVVTIAVTDATGKRQVGTAHAVVDRLEPGQSSTPDTPTAEKAMASMRCKVASAQRTVS